jgi:hypothetical protein
MCNNIGNSFAVRLTSVLKQAFAGKKKRSYKNLDYAPLINHTYTCGGCCTVNKSYKYLQADLVQWYSAASYIPGVHIHCPLLLPGQSSSLLLCRQVSKTKRWLSWLTNSALVFEPKSGERGELGGLSQ